MPRYDRTIKKESSSWDHIDENGELLCEFCATIDLVIGGTLFQQGYHTK